MANELANSTKKTTARIGSRNPSTKVKPPNTESKTTITTPTIRSFLVCFSIIYIIY